MAEPVLTKELLAQLAAQIAAALIGRIRDGNPLPSNEHLALTSIDIAKAILEEAEKRFPKGQSLFG